MSAGSAQLQELPATAAWAVAHRCVEVAICPPAPLLLDVVAYATDLAAGAQDCHDRGSEPFTGCLPLNY